MPQRKRSSRRPAIRSQGRRPFRKSGSSIGAASRETTDRKLLQLCRQAEQTIDSVLAGELDDDVLRDLQVLKVEPAAASNRLIVTVAPRDPTRPADLGLIAARLESVSHTIRSELATSITRRRVPALTFLVVPADLESLSSPGVSGPESDADTPDPAP
jgi:ribosome-binding factor A